MKHCTRDTVTPQLVVGILIMALGALLMLDRLEILHAGRTLRFWPAGVIAIGATLLIRRKDSQGRFWGYAWIFTGTWLLLTSIGLVRVSFWDLLWPLVLVVFGLNLIRQTLRRGPEAASATAANKTNGSSRLFAIMGETRRSLDDQPFRGGQMTAVLGGCVLDLSQASMAPGDEATVDILGVRLTTEFGAYDAVRAVEDAGRFRVEVRLPAVTTTLTTT